jgi:hypothetical protein
VWSLGSLKLAGGKQTIMIVSVYFRSRIANIYRPMIDLRRRSRPGKSKDENSQKLFEEDSYEIPR